MSALVDRQFENIIVGGGIKTKLVDLLLTVTLIITDIFAYIRLVYVYV